MKGWSRSCGRETGRGRRGRRGGRFAAGQTEAGAWHGSELLAAQECGLSAHDARQRLECSATRHSEHCCESEASTTGLPVRSPMQAGGGGHPPTLTPTTQPLPASKQGRGGGGWGRGGGTAGQAHLRGAPHKGQELIVVQAPHAVAARRLQPVGGLRAGGAVGRAAAGRLSCHKLQRRSEYQAARPRRGSPVARNADASGPARR